MMAENLFNRMRACAFAGLAASVAASANGDEVRASLVIPAAPTHVIGDPLPLLWRFENSATEPLAFVWEGCCRQNGHLDVTRNGQPVDLIPPSQALAHMFAKAEVLAPGEPREFFSRLNDWVHLPGTGVYEFSGRYTGVLPTQQPNVRGGERLWRDHALTPTNRVAFLSVTDYLAERAGRELQRGLAMQVTGPAQLPLLEPATCEVSLHNRSAQDMVVKWPSDLRLWLVDAEGARVPNLPAELASPYSELTLGAGTVLTRSFTLDSEALVGLPLGDYTLFVDLAGDESGALPRVPSTSMAITWSITDPDLPMLLDKAVHVNRRTRGNPALKLLRTYLAEVGPRLASLELPEDERALAADLSAAARLKPVEPNPGSVEIVLAYGIGGFEFADPRLRETLTGETLWARFDRLIELRRHLGWNLKVILEAPRDTPFSEITGATAELQKRESDIPGGIGVRAAPDRE